MATSAMVLDGREAGIDFQWSLRDDENEMLSKVDAGGFHRSGTRARAGTFRLDRDRNQVGGFGDRLEGKR